MPDLYTTVSSLTSCDLCRSLGLDPVLPAVADARIPAIGSWANVCLPHFTELGCSLGLGRGQQLVVEAPEPA